MAQLVRRTKLKLNPLFEETQSIGVVGITSKEGRRGGPSISTRFRGAHRI